MKQVGSSIRLIRIREMLYNETDIDKHLSTKQIMKALEKEGIFATRQTLYKDIKLLQKFGVAVEMKKSTANEYYIADKDFDRHELHILVDAVQAAAFITEKKTAELLDKIYAMGGLLKDDIKKSNIVKLNIIKSENERIYYNIDSIIEAIGKKKKISFLYFEYTYQKRKKYRDGKKPYSASPLGTILWDGHYYLLAHSDKYLTVVTYRIDRMDEVSVTDEPIKSDIDVDLAKYPVSAFDMYGGRVENVYMKLKEEKLVQVIMDKFGRDIKFTKVDSGGFEFHTDVQISDRFFAWIVSFKGGIEILAPSNVLDEFHSFVKDTYSTFSEKQ